MAVARATEQVRSRRPRGRDGEGRLRPSWYAVGWAVVALVVAASLVGLGVFLPRLSAASARGDERAQILHAARQEAIDFTTLDYRHLDADLGRVLAGSTGSFGKEYRAGAAQLRAMFNRYHTTATGQVLEAGLVSSDPDSARVLVVADQTVHSAQSTTDAPDQRHYRMQLDLVLRDGRWLVSDLQFVG